MGANIGSPAKLGVMSSARGVADPQKRVFSHVCYPAEFGRSGSNGVDINRSSGPHPLGVPDQKKQDTPVPLLS